MQLCRFIVQRYEFGHQILLQGILWEALKLSPLVTSLLSMQLCRMLYGSGIFRWRCPCLSGVSYGIVFRPKIFIVALSLLMIRSVFQSEKASHLFLDCSFFGALWIDVYCWLGIVAVCRPDWQCIYNSLVILVVFPKSHLV